METHADTPQESPREPAKPRRRATRAPETKVETAAPIALGEDTVVSDTAMPDASAAPHNGTEQAATERAEEIFDEFGQRVGQAASVLMLNLKRFAARTQEEAEDIWAEAQELRRGKRP